MTMSRNIQEKQEHQSGMIYWAFSKLYVDLKHLYSFGRFSGYLWIKIIFDMDSIDCAHRYKQNISEVTWLGERKHCLWWVCRRILRVPSLPPLPQQLMPRTSNLEIYLT